MRSHFIILQFRTRKLWNIYRLCSFFYFIHKHCPHLWPLSKSKFNLKSDRVNLVAPASPILLLYLPNVRAIQYKLGPERLTRLGNSNVLRLPVIACNQTFSIKVNLHLIKNIPVGILSSLIKISGKSVQGFTSNERTHSDYYFIYRFRLAFSYLHLFYISKVLEFRNGLP